MKQDIIEKGPLEWRAARSGNPGGLLCLLVQSWVLWRRGLFLGCPCPITLLVSIYCLTQGFSRWHAALPVKTDSSREFPGGWQDVLCMAQHLLPLFRPSQILRVGDSLSFLCSLLEPSRERQLVQVVVFIPGQGRSFRSMVP